MYPSNVNRFDELLNLTAINFMWPLAHYLAIFWHMSRSETGSARRRSSASHPSIRVISGFRMSQSANRPGRTNSMMLVAPPVSLDMGSGSCKRERMRASLSAQKRYSVSDTAGRESKLAAAVDLRQSSTLSLNTNNHNQSLQSLAPPIVAPVSAGFDSDAVDKSPCSKQTELQLQQKPKEGNAADTATNTHKAQQAGEGVVDSTTSAHVIGSRTQTLAESCEPIVSDRSHTRVPAAAAERKSGLKIYIDVI